MNCIVFQCVREVYLDGNYGEQGQGMVCLGVCPQVYLHLCTFVMLCKKGKYVLRDNPKLISLIRYQDKTFIGFFAKG